MPTLTDSPMYRTLAQRLLGGGGFQPPAPGAPPPAPVDAPLQPHTPEPVPPVAATPPLPPDGNTGITGGLPPGTVPVDPAAPPMPNQDLPVPPAPPAPNQEVPAAPTVPEPPPPPPPPPPVAPPVPAPMDEAAQRAAFERLMQALMQSTGQAPVTPGVPAALPGPPVGAPPPSPGAVAPPSGRFVQAGHSGSAPPGFSNTKWDDPNHQTPKYIWGRAMNAAQGELQKLRGDEAGSKAFLQQLATDLKPQFEKAGAEVLEISGEGMIIDMHDGGGPHHVDLAQDVGGKNATQWHTPDDDAKKPGRGGMGGGGVGAGAGGGNFLSMLAPGLMSGQGGNFSQAGLLAQRALGGGFGGFGAGDAGAKGAQEGTKKQGMRELLMQRMGGQRGATR